MSTGAHTRERMVESLTGCLLGTAVGDALGLPREGLSRRRAARLFGTPPLAHRLLFGHGMLSDDTDHAILVAESLLAAPADAGVFAAGLARRLRWWLARLPAGTGLATARAIVKLWLGWPPARSGVPSAGNGPAMRAPLIGAAFAFRPGSPADFIAASTRITHADPRAEEGALLVALAAREGALHGPARDPAALLAGWRAAVTDGGLRAALDTMTEHLARNASVETFADALGLSRGVSGFISHTVPVALYAWLRHPDDFRAAVETAIALGGDADTTGAITGGLAGATLGEQAIPTDWIDGLAGWPQTVGWMRRLCVRLADTLASGMPARPPACPWPALAARNLLLLLVVLYHGFRRLLPPY